MADKQHADPSISTTKVGTEERRVHLGKIDFSRTQAIRFYANHVGTNVTLFDIRLILSDVDIVGDGVSAVQTLTVLMSPEVAKLSHTLLGHALQQYEKAYGATRLPEAVVEQSKRSEESQE